MPRPAWFSIASGWVSAIREHPTVEVFENEGNLVGREVAEAVEVKPLADDLRLDDSAPSARQITNTIGSEKLVELQFVDALFAQR